MCRCVCVCVAVQTLSGHLRQKGAELAGLQEQAQLVEKRHEAELHGLRSSLQAASDELRQLGAGLDSTREEKFALQAQVTELRAALKTSSTQVKVSVTATQPVGESQTMWAGRSEQCDSVI